MQVQKNISLLPYNSFHLAANASEFLIVQSVPELQDIIGKSGKTPLLILGGGSNILLTKNIDGLVLKIAIRGIEVLREETSHIFVKAGAGENWHEFVEYTMERNRDGRI